MKVSDLDHAAREALITLAENPELDEAGRRRFHMANILIGEFRERLRNLYREPDGKMPDGWAVA